MKRITQFVVALLLMAVGAAALADTIPSTPNIRHTGQFNYVTTGGSLRTASNTVNACTVGSSSSQALAGIPGGSSIVAAYLYWGGSGGTVDSSVILNGNTVSASRTFTESSGGNLFFGGFADVTSLVVGNGTYAFSGLTVNSGDPYCNPNGNVMAGWSLVVIYGSNSEPLRAINIFDGLQAFYNSQLSLTVNGFRIPGGGIDGKMTAITWEGDDNLGGASEFLTFGGNTLDAQGYNSSSIFASGSVGTTTYGVDVDTYNISPYLTSGATSFPTAYSAGGDRVFLTAQIISVTSEPVVDLSITKTHTGNFTVGSNGSFTLHVANGNSAGIISVDYPITVTDVLPTGLTFVSGTGTGWTCSAAAQTVTCTNPNTSFLAPGNALPDITLTVAVGNSVFPNGNTAQNVGVSNTATVAAAGTVDITSTNNSATDTVTILGSNLSTSTKSVSDLNGGEANVGDTLRYTITLTDTSGVATTGAVVTDNVPGNVSGFSVVSIPTTASNGSTGTSTGTNNTGYLNITGINVPANGSAAIVFDVTVATGTSPGATIDNTATISNPAGIGTTPSAPQIVVSPSLVAGSGTKQLYLYGQTGGTPAYPTSRTAPATAQTAVTIAKNTNVVWRLNSPLRSAVTLQAGSQSVRLWLSRSNNGTSRTVSVTLGWATSLTAAPTPIASGTVTFSGTTDLGTSVLLQTISLAATNSGIFVVPAGGYFTLQVNNNTGGSNNRDIVVSFTTGISDSRVELNSASVINVDSVQTFSAAYSGGVVTSSFNRGTTAYIRAVVSDPFGSFDISSATLTLRNPSGTDVVTVTNVAMSSVNDSGAALKTYEYTYVIPAAASAGVWTARVTANEGAEGTITDLGVGTFTVTIPMPTLQVSKVSSVVWDPVNLGSNPKRIPGSIISYTITVTNSGPGTVDASTLVMTDVVPANTSLCVSAIAQCTAIQFADGSPVSGLSYSSNTTYSNTTGGGTPFTYSPTANVTTGVDAAVTGIRVAPTGTMNAVVTTGSNPSFTISFRVKVN